MSSALLPISLLPLEAPDFSIDHGRIMVDRWTPTFLATAELVRVARWGVPELGASLTIHCANGHAVYRVANVNGDVLRLRLLHGVRVGEVVIVSFVHGGEKRGTVERCNPKRLHVRLLSGTLVERRYGEVRPVWGEKWATP